jgi:hypothetical protein
MDSKDLRIGNHVYLIAEGHEDEPDLVEWKLEDYDFYENKMEYIEPIPLTEEWLLKFGFKNNRLGLFDCFKEVEDIGFRIYFIGKHLREVQYVNQLQNLYFVLMGTELIIKE